MAVNKEVCNVTGWIEENKQYFLPPVCNKMMHKEGQMKVFFVGGPNQRKDYHIECGEELFLQIKGDMVLKIVEKNKHRDIPIKQGQMFLLPCRLPHSPQRWENTVGLVIERDRHPSEYDGLRYYVEKDGEPTLDSLFEKWFYCTDLGTQLGPVIKEFFASEQCKTGKPLPGTIPEKCPVELDTEREIQEPFYFQEWVDKRRDTIDREGRMAVFDCDNYQFRVYVYGSGENSEKIDTAETWIWQWEGESNLDIEGQEYNLKKDDSCLIPQGKRFKVKQQKGSLALVCYQDPTRAKTWPKED